MKKLTLILLLLLTFAASAFAQDMSIVKGTWEREKAENIKLYQIDKNYALDEIASSSIGDDGSFTFAFRHKSEDVFVIGTSTGPINLFCFYFKPGDQLNLKVTANSYLLEGENTPENKEMAKWHDYIQPLEEMAIYFARKKSTYVDFFPVLEEKVEALGSYPKANTSNRLFNERFEDFKRFNFLDIAISFLYTPRTAHPQGEDFPDYYRNINLADLTKTAAILNYPRIMDLLPKVILTNYRFDQSITDEEKGKKMQDPTMFFLNDRTLGKIVNDTVKGEIVFYAANMKKTYDGLVDINKTYGKYLITDSQKERIKKAEVALNKPGENAIDFKFKDREGKEIALSSFKGKVVYVDIWATWCGPCRKEFPHLKELEKEYHGNNDIVFIGVSVDVSADEKKWLAFLDKEQLPGIQIFAGDEAKTTILKDYKVKGIPRFLLIGKDGKLISNDAPRPSQAELKLALSGALKK